LNLQQGENRIRLQLPADLLDGTYLLHLFHNGRHVSRLFQVHRTN